MPTALKKIGHLIRTQDNRCTDQPMFIVQENVKDWHITADEATGHVWKDDDYDDPDEKMLAWLERLESWDDIPKPWHKHYFRTRWEFVTACFTEQGCKDYMACNKHNHTGELRIYGWHSFRNAEFRSVRTFLIGLEDPDEGGN